MSPTTRDECIDSAAEAYGAILADPIRREEIRARMAEYAAAQTASSTPAGGQVLDTRVRAVGGQRERTRQSA